MNEIRREIEGIRFRIAASVDALVYKADVPARLADALSSTASSFTARLLRRPTAAGEETEDETGRGSDLHEADAIGPFGS